MAAEEGVQEGDEHPKAESGDQIGSRGQGGDVMIILDQALQADGHQRPPHRADASNCAIPKMFPSVSLQYTSQPTPGIGILGTATDAPSFCAVAVDSSRLVTSMVQT